MGIKNAVEAQERTRGGLCTFVSIYSTISRKDAAELREVLAARTPRGWEFSSEAIARALTADVLKVSSSTVGRHRLGECSCGAV